jgi:hypothetical protein
MALLGTLDGVEQGGVTFGVFWIHGKECRLVYLVPSDGEWHFK